MNTIISSGVIDVAGSGTVVSGKNYLSGVTLSSAAAASTVTVYDNTAASGNILFQAKVPATNLTEHYDFSKKIQAYTGLHVVVTGVGAEAIIYYG